MIRFLKRLLARLSIKTAHLFRNILSVSQELIGIRKNRRENQLDCDQLIRAGWIFLLGMPLGAMLIGVELFSVPFWAGCVLLVLMLINLDKALVQIRRIRSRAHTRRSPYVRSNN